jgi:NAD(P)-dependent dehydrogenase (short-subunit alcohol dehydrogenase family)
MEMNKVALITGGTGNLGKATVNKFLNEGFIVIATVSPGKKPSTTTNNIFYEEVDLKDEGACGLLVDKITKTHQRIDAVVCTAGGFEAGNIHKGDGESLKRMLSLNFETAYYIARPAFEVMSDQSGGKIIFIGSRPGVELERAGGVVSYALSKSLLKNFADILNAEGKKHKVSAHIVAPSTIDTPENRAAMPDGKFDELITPEKLAGLIYDVVSGKFSDVVVKAY